MSTLKVSEIRNASSATGGLSIAADGVVSGALPYPNRNLLYNGAMQVAQRGTSTAGITASGYYAADRWKCVVRTQGTWTNTVENDAPAGSGFVRSSKVLCTTADASPAAADLVRFETSLEGQDVQRICQGTSNAKPLTLSFWVKGNVTGTYIIELRNLDASRSISASYSISASATWEKKVVTFPADTTGTFDNDNAQSLVLHFYLGAGSDSTSGTLNTYWGTRTDANTAVGQTNLAAATNNYWQITGVQLEVGDTATEVEFKSFGQELAECQRYYYLHASGNAKRFTNAAQYSAALAIGTIHFPVEMRAEPVLIVSSGSNYYGMFRSGGQVFFNSFNIARPSRSNSGWDVAVSGTTGHAGVVDTNNAASLVAFSAEL